MLKFIGKNKITQITKTILNKTNNAEAIANLWQSNCKKTAWYWHKNRHEEKWNRIETTK
jgi:hypothetical protein